MNYMKRASLYIFYGLLAYMPLHIFLSTWIGTSFGILEFSKVAKDIVLVIGFALAVAASVKKPWFLALLKDRLRIVIFLYALLTIALALLKPTDLDAEILGIVYNLRFLLFLLYGALLVNFFESTNILKRSVKIVLSIAAVVTVFGVVQYTLLPNNALEHVGYTRANGVLPAFFIDDKPDLERVMSTLRDPNSFGSYIIIILSLAAAYLSISKNKEVRRFLIGLIALGALCLWFTFSRSAWLGALLALGILVILKHRKTKGFKFGTKTYVAVVVLLIISLLSLIPLRNTYFVQNVIFHADESTELEDPNQLRVRFWQESINAAVDEPLGHGPGTAGLASIRNDLQGPVLNENYYLQILHETGVTGLLLFSTILIIVVLRLYKLAGRDVSVLAMLAAFAGLFLTNFLVHIWSNEAVAYTFWGLAGIIIYRGKSNNKQSSKSWYTNLN
jgi:putative inorganic carbon (HCO3(-)) transporter